MTSTDRAMSKRPLRLLIAEDRSDDLLLLLHQLDRGGYAVHHTCVDRMDTLREALATEEWELVLSDFAMPGMTALDVLRVVQAERPDLPCIVISGTIAEESAVEVLRAGARDFVVKERLTRLVPAIERELREAAERRRRREAETSLADMRQRMQFALESVAIGIWELDIPSGRMAWSDVQERLHGLAPGSFGGTLEVFIDTMHPDDRERVLRGLEEGRRQEGDSRMEYRTIWPDGSVRWLASIGRHFLDRSGRPVRAVGVVMDVTAQKHLEEQFRQAQKMESIGNLAGGIAHDFNNLLTVIAGCCDLAADRVAADPEAAEAIEGIRTAAASASALTRQLLTFSRRQLVVPRLLDLNDAITGFRRILRRLVEENVHIEVGLAEGLPPVRVDPGQIEQLLLNLVANARDAMRDGGTVTIQTRHVVIGGDGRTPEPDVPPGAYVVLSVGDTGTGMSEEVRAHLFEPFFTTKASGRGTGLGLATVYGIVRQSGGHILVHSAHGSGTTFEIYLPAIAEGHARERAEEKSGPIELSGSETVLVVEDNAPLRRLNQRILQQYGYVVLSAANGEQAQQLVSEYHGPIHVVLMDVIMPGESGPIVWDRISQRRPDTRVIYMSGYTGDAIDHRNVVGPGSVFLQKPFEPRQLARAIRDVLS